MNVRQETLGRFVVAEHFLLQFGLDAKVVEL
jgi:hypothetical protein